MRPQLDHSWTAVGPQLGTYT